MTGPINFRPAKNIAMMTIVFCSFLFTSLNSYASTSRNPEEHFFDATFGNFKEELAQAKEQGKKAVMIFFEMDECPFCHWMKKNVLNQVNVQEYYKKNFLVFTVDIEGDVEITNFQGKEMTQKDFAFKENRVRATPVIAFFDLEGNRVMRFTGRTKNVEEFMLMGQFVVDKAYETEKFSRYKRKHNK